MQKFSDTIASVTNGVLTPLSAANVTVRIAGSASLASIFSDSAGAVPLGNPFQSSSLGLVEFYAADGRYDVVLTKAGYSTVTVSDVLLEDPTDGVDDDLTGVTITDATIANPTITGGTQTDISSITFSATPDTLVARMMTWNPTEETVDLKLNGSGVTLQLGQEMLYRVRNLTGSTIANGTCVAAAGTVGNSGRILVTPAIADGAMPAKQIMGVATEDIPDGADGFITHFGKVRDVNTTGAAVGETWADGDILYAHPTIYGGLTNVAPAVPNVATVVALVLRATSNGTLVIRVTPETRDSDVVRFTPASGPITSVEAAIRDLQARVTALETP